MLGAIIGDIVGSQYEFSNRKGFYLPLFSGQISTSTEGVSTFTDDTILTLATASQLKADVSEPDFRSAYLRYFSNYSGQKANGPGIGVGFGGMFVRWAMGEDEDYAPYNSWGNGGAMRVSPVAWFAQSEEEVLRLAKASSMVTHSHQQGIDGSQAVALAIWLARQGKSSDAIYEAMSERFGYRFNFTLDYLERTYVFSEYARDSVPQAIFCALEADCFEDALRNVLKIGGDTDTIGAMAGSIAQAKYGIPPRFYSFLNPLEKWAPELYEEAMAFHNEYCRDSIVPKDIGLFERFKRKYKEHRC